MCPRDGVYGNGRVLRATTQSASHEGVAHGAGLSAAARRGEHRHTVALEGACVSWSELRCGCQNNGQRREQWTEGMHGDSNATSRTLAPDFSATQATIEAWGSDGSTKMVCDERNGSDVPLARSSRAF